ncbi:hypothetical protein CLAFUW4_11578 [Fulvia fulva]|uniref:CFEM domain-containing protein n=1 Tax=Passalora fulva TaxID=5499 RepID=A0A9Q8URR5_PASFU|nr:uncharacterized protein CLAFUR5_10621 [Fulvia fulva]KAK4620395.1 hypothetical protein CLAFUR0_11592 [Fulvia fulva]UJO20018.1 hypothetical protein CLAFUR5_10621 [Fulvia fulva]WPV17331.1 hypothetical protein CLAFUW4_11578 [Fulvia fulva]WPV32532.1 hypothetical protein CLAFUW7_11582 [Fulvia fulva]
MHFTTTAIAAAGLAAHQVIATGGYGGGWGGSGHYSTPDNTNNECTSEQSTGYNWSGLKDGSFDSYGSNKFSGWSCTNSFGKRDLLTKRSFQSKCISADLDKEPVISCDDDKTMSLDKFEVSSDQDADIECHYTMPDESICKEVHSCSARGTVIQNSQCGGAKSVTFKPAGDSKGKGCNIGVHSVGFNCGSASSTPPSYSSTAPPSYSTSSSVESVDTTSVPTAPAYESSSVETSSATTSSAIECGYGSTQSVPAYGSSTVCVAITSSSSTEEAPVTTSSTDSAPAYTAPAYGSSSSSTEGSPVTTTSVPTYSTGTVPSNNGTYSAPSAPGYGSSSEVSTVTTAPSYSAPASVTSAVPTYEGPKPESPNLLPKCLNTWMYLTTCKDNSDYSCFCKNAEFVKQVYQCVSSWSTTDDDTTSGASYFMGICAPYIPENPAVITACPSTVTPAATFSYAPISSIEGSPVESSAPASSPKTVTLYSTQINTVTSCGPEVTNCPAATQTSSYAIATTISTPEAPLTTAPASSSTEGSPVNSSPAVTPAASIPCTTITYSTEYPVPVTYTTGENQGNTIPSSSTTSTIITTVTVPQVQMTTYTVTQGSSTQEQPGLGYGTPVAPVTSAPGYTSAPTAPAAAPYPTTSAPGPVGPVGGGGASSGFGTTYVPAPSNSITPYEGAGGKVSISGVAFMVVVCALFF